MRINRLAALAATLIAIPGVAAAQNPLAERESALARLPRLTAGRTVTGALTARDSVCGTLPCDVYRYVARLGEQLTITLRSRRFDAVLILQQPDEDVNLYEVSQSDQGFEIGTDSQLEWEVDVNGTLIVIVTMSWHEDETAAGPYTLRLTSRRARPSR